MGFLEYTQIFLSLIFFLPNFLFFPLFLIRTFVGLPWFSLSTLKFFLSIFFGFKSLYLFAQKMFCSVRRVNNELYIYIYIKKRFKRKNIAFLFMEFLSLSD